MNSYHIRFNSLLCSLVLFICEITATWALNCQTTELPTNHPIQSLFLNTGSSQTQWLGGDSDTSILLDNDTMVWAFGDTLLGDYPSILHPKDIKAFTHDSFAIITHLRDQQPEIHFFTQHNTTGQPASFLKPDNPNHYFWILSAAMVESSLVLGLAEIQNTPQSFRIVGTSLAIIENPKESPSAWNISLVNLNDSLAEEAKQFLWGTGLIFQPPYLYLLGSSLNNEVNASMALARIDYQAVLQQHFTKIAFLTEAIQESTALSWQATPNQLNPLHNIKGLPWMTEFSTIHVSHLDRWFTLYIPPFGTNIHLFQAQTLSGPWEDLGIIHHIPAPWSTTKKGSEPVFISYAAKLHPGLGLSTSNNQLTFTFSYINNLNTFNFPTLWEVEGKSLLTRYPRLYTPILVEASCDIPMKFSSNEFAD